MKPVFQVAAALQTVFTTTAKELARSTGVVVRERKFDGASLAQTFVFGWLSNPRATLDELAQMAASCGAAVQPQAVAQRITDDLVEFFKQLLEVAAGQVVVAAQGVSIELLQRFNGVYLHDSTTIPLPEEFTQAYPGCGGGKPGQKNAAVKFQVRMNLLDGNLQGPFPEAGKASDQSSRVQRLPLPAGALRIADLGYFCLQVLADLALQQVFWISRIQVAAAVFHEGKRLELGDWLRHQKTQSIDLPVEVGASGPLPCRLLAVRCPNHIVRRRVAAVKEDARRRGRTPSQARLQWCHWTVLITNVPVEKLSIREAVVLYRARWQIELLFKLWKQLGLVDESRFSSPEARLVEIYAKLIGQIIQHWLLITSVWSYSDRSLTKASKTVQKHVVLLIAYLHSHLPIEAAIRPIQQALASCGRIDRRRGAPNTHQLLENPELLAYEGLT